MNFIDNEWTDMKDDISNDLNNIDFNVSSISNLPQNSYNYINEWGTNPIVLIVLVIVIVIYYILFAFLGAGTGSGSPSLINSENRSIVYVEALLWGLFIVLILMNGVSYFFNINIIASLKNMFSTTPEIVVKAENLVEDVEKGFKDEMDKIKKDISSSSASSSKKSKETGQVFNIPENEYTYEDANALCKAYDAKLATYEQIETAYKKGASWCNYGWSDNQMAFFPTNKDVWEKLQKIKGHEHDCGRIGINGGYIANPNVRFGVNCYGNKPDITSKESKLMSNQTLYPKSLEDYEIDKKSEQYKKQLNKLLVSPFNNSNWSVPIPIKKPTSKT